MRRTRRSWMDEFIEKIILFAILAGIFLVLNHFFPQIGIFLTSPIGTLPFGG